STSGMERLRSRTAQALLGHGQRDDERSRGRSVRPAAHARVRGLRPRLSCLRGDRAAFAAGSRDAAGDHGVLVGAPARDGGLMGKAERAMRLPPIAVPFVTAGVLSIVTWYGLPVAV